MSLPDKQAAERINELHGQIEAAFKISLEQAIEIGKILHEVKAGLPHGDFTPWLKGNVQFSERAARNYMKLHREKGRIEEAESLSEAYAMLAPPKEEPKTANVAVLPEEATRDKGEYDNMSVSEVMESFPVWDFSQVPATYDFERMMLDILPKVHRLLEQTTLITQIALGKPGQGLMKQVWQLVELHIYYMADVGKLGLFPAKRKHEEDLERLTAELAHGFIRRLPRFHRERYESLYRTSRVSVAELPSLMLFTTRHVGKLAKQKKSRAGNA